MNVHFMLHFVAFLCFGAAAISVPTPRVNLIALGLALWMLSMLLV